MSETLSTHDIGVHDPGSIVKDEPGIITYRDSRGNIKKINPDISFGSNLENTLGPEYLKKLGGTLWEGVWKSAATFIPAGSTLKVAIAYTGAKILTKSVGTAGNYIITGEYGTGKAIKKALIVNSLTPTNYAPIANAPFAKNTVVGKTFGSYYTVLAGNGRSANILQKNRIDYVSINHIGNKHVHLHGNIYPLSPLLQAESKVFGYGGYNVISGKNPYEVAHANQIHSNDTQHKETVKNTHQQGVGQNVHEKVPVHQAEPKSGGHHDEGPYQGAFLPFTVEATRALSNEIKSGYEGGIQLEAGYDMEYAMWQDKVNKADGVIDTTIEYIKGVPNELANAAMRDVILFNRYVSIPIFDILASGVAETAVAIDKSIAGVTDYALAAGNIAAAKLSNSITLYGGGRGARNPYDEAIIVKDANGRKTITYVGKVRQDETLVKKPPVAKLLVDVKKEKQASDEAYRKLMGWNRNTSVLMVDQNSSQAKAANAAIYGAAGKPKTNNFIGYAPFSSAPIATNQQIQNRTTISQNRK